MMPFSLVQGGVLQAVEFPKTVIYYWKNKQSGNDLIFYGSWPPAVRHYAFASLIVDITERFHTERIYTIGGMCSDVTHLEEPQVLSLMNDPALEVELEGCGLQLGYDYHGPSSVNALILSIARERSMGGISLCGRVPSYLGDLSIPRIWGAVLRILTRLLRIDIDFSDLEAMEQDMDVKIDEIVANVRQRNPEFDQYVGRLEKGSEEKASEIDKRNIFEEIDGLLKRQNSEEESP
ncbi:PAC2 family protein [Chloroflexota bacterium]